ncbi:hypothetical protein E1200_23060 [Actinomadura sp. GC306]|uniref:hypothetical protein n=1 Tax=Actinomadura sp. GC306 TaxID=2530367 RepID=UPI00104826AD|nr:hypothetical protein [Actinomadura sp. GC306]TDC63228.1 hypothetical protein E1200_23060 [Actinomadura sp. GC306]
MISMMTKSAQSWTAACPGISTPGAPAAYLADSGVRLRGSLGMSGKRGMGGEPNAVHLVQRIQDDLGRSVFGHLIEDTAVPASATAHTGVTVEGGVSGPYPWRRPV